MSLFTIFSRWEGQTQRTWSQTLCHIVTYKFVRRGGLRGCVSVLCCTNRDLPNADKLWLKHCFSCLWFGFFFIFHNVCNSSEIQNWDNFREGVVVWVFVCVCKREINYFNLHSSNNLLMDVLKKKKQNTKLLNLRNVFKYIVLHSGSFKESTAVKSCQILWIIQSGRSEILWDILIIQLQ